MSQTHFIKKDIAETTKTGMKMDINWDEKLTEWWKNTLYYFILHTVFANLLGLWFSSRKQVKYKIIKQKISNNCRKKWEHFLDS